MLVARVVATAQLERPPMRVRFGHEVAHMSVLAPRSKIAATTRVEFTAWFALVSKSKEQCR